MFGILHSGSEFEGELRVDTEEEGGFDGEDDHEWPTNAPVIQVSVEELPGIL